MLIMGCVCQCVSIILLSAPFLCPSPGIHTSQIPPSLSLLFKKFSPQSAIALLISVSQPWPFFLSSFLSLFLNLCTWYCFDASAQSTLTYYPFSCGKKRISLSCASHSHLEPAIHVNPSPRCWIRGVQLQIPKILLVEEKPAWMKEEQGEACVLSAGHEDRSNKSRSTK